MGRRSARPPRARRAGERASDLEGFLVPETVFSDPFEVVANGNLCRDEKRAILARWLMRICAQEAAADLKWMPRWRSEGAFFDDVMDALRAIEHDHAAPAASSKPQTGPGRKLPRPVGTIH